MPLTEAGKEFHLEVILKATAFGHRIREIPAVLEWKQHKRQGQVVKRVSSSKVKRLIVSHSLFSIFANPVRYVWLLSAAFFGIGTFFVVTAFVLFYLGQVSAYNMLFGLSLSIVGMLLFVLGVVLKQGNIIQRELWMMQRGHAASGTAMQDPVSKTSDSEQPHPHG
jgi:hypothetical protein